MNFLIILFCSLELILAKVDSPSLLIFNEFDSLTPKLELSKQFPEKNFINGKNNDSFLFSLDSLKNPASGRMSLVRSLGKDFDVDYILFNQIKNDNSRIFLEGQMFSARSGGMIHRNIVDITKYYKGQINELKLWIGSIFNEIDKEWAKNREIILFEDPEAIVQDKTPAGAMARSLLLPGWGQFYSDAYTSGYLFSGIETSLLTTILVAYLGYNKSVNSFKTSINNYNNAPEQSDFDKYRKIVNTEEKNYKSFNSLMKYSAIGAGSFWIVNGIHAYIVGPRPEKDIIQKWDIVPSKSK